MTSDGCGIDDSRQHGGAVEVEGLSRVGEAAIDLAVWSDPQNASVGDGNLLRPRVVWDLQL